MHLIFHTYLFAKQSELVDNQNPCMSFSSFEFVELSTKYFTCYLIWYNYGPNNDHYIVFLKYLL